MSPTPADDQARRNVARKLIEPYLASGEMVPGEGASIYIDQVLTTPPGP